jgi:tripartite-type tricarboxylate transporter receptor subunit TctC
MNRSIVTLGTAFAAALLASSAFAAEDFYAGKTIRIVVGSAAGGGYDSVARTIQRHMPKYIPGNPTMIVVNMPGAGGVTAANNLANVAERDGTVIGVANRFAPMQAALGAEQAKYKATDFQWIGTTGSYRENSYLFIIRSALPYKTAQELMKKTDKPLPMGDSGSDVPAILKEALGLNIQLIQGYKGSDDLELAFERGEVDGHTSGLDSVISRHPQWFPQGFIRPLIQFGRADRLKVKELEGVPTARELAPTQEDRNLIEFAEMPLMIARPVLAPPGTPKERVDILRAAFMKMVADKAYAEDSEKQTLENTPSSGAEVQGIVEKMTNEPVAVKQRYLKALGGKVPS